MTNAAEANCKVGFRNCTNPTVDMRTRRAAKLNNTKGPAVSGPEIASKRMGADHRFRHLPLSP